jgi:hypothetical protein
MSNNKTNSMKNNFKRRIIYKMNLSKLYKVIYKINFFILDGFNVKEQKIVEEL